MKKKLIRIQQKLKVGKNQYNSFGGYNFRSAEDILTALKPLCAEENVCIVISDELVNINERYYVKATVNLVDESGEVIVSTTAYAREEESKKGMDGSQITGASSSYARKYALNGMFMIDDVKDSDSTNTHSKEVKAEKIEELKCPKCGGKITQQALEKWGMCSQCKQNEVKNG